MKNKVLALLIMLGVLLVPFKTSAKEYKTLNFEEALKEEEIEPNFKDYKETDNAVTIYLFRGKGCAYCRKFLTFMNDITPEYGKYFKIVSFEVWNDNDNATLLDQVSEYLGEPAEGVPYIIIGKKVFPGFTESAYGDEIKQTITETYKTTVKDRYDVLEEMEKNPTPTNNNESEKDNKTSSSSNVVVVLLNLLFVCISTAAVIAFVNYKFNQLALLIDNVDDGAKNDEKEKKTK